MIAVAKRQRFEGARYQIVGEVSKQAGIYEVINFPYDGTALTLTGLTIKATFRRCPDDTSADVTLSTGTNITITDADTLTFAATPAQLDSLCEGAYYFDIATSNGSVTTHLASGQVSVHETPVAI